MGGSEPNGENITVPTYVRRAHSCPEIKKERPSFTGPDSGDDNLDETLELEASLEAPTTTTGTQTADQDLPALYPYEHMFLALFPPESRPEVARASAGHESPTSILDQYLELAAARRTSDEPVLKRSLSGSSPCSFFYACVMVLS